MILPLRILISIISLPCFPHWLLSQPLFHADYNPVAAGGTGNTSVTDHAGPLTFLQQHFHPGRAILVADGVETPRRMGRPEGSVVRFETRQEDGDFDQTRGNRSELRFDSQLLGDAHNQTPLEIWYAWSLFVPYPVDSNAEWDGSDDAYPKVGCPKHSSDGGGREIYFQVHAPDDIALDGNPGNPPLSLRRIPDARFPGKGRLELNWRWDLNHTGCNDSEDLGEFPLGQWTDFVLRVVWTNDPSGRGSLVLWKDDRKVVEKEGMRVGYRNMDHMYLKIGIYAFDWNSNKEPDRYRAIAYFDELKLHSGVFATLETGFDALKPRGEDVLWFPSSTGFTPSSEKTFAPYYFEKSEPSLAEHRVAIRTDLYGTATAAAEMTFKGTKALYAVKLQTIAEEDGESTYEVTVNGRSLGRKTNPPSVEKRLRAALDFGRTSLAPGDKIRVLFAGASNRKIPEAGGFAHARGRWRGLELKLVK